MPREKLIGCRVNETEHAAITAAAQAAGHRDVTSYIRDRLGLNPPTSTTDQQTTNGT